jgi:hypothetical protein
MEDIFGNNPPLSARDQARQEAMQREREARMISVKDVEAIDVYPTSSNINNNHSSNSNNNNNNSESNMEIIRKLSMVIQVSEEGRERFSLCLFILHVCLSCLFQKMLIRLFICLFGIL